MIEVWKEMERMVDLGLTKSIGVSNFPVVMMIDLLTYCKIKPVTNQVEMHPYFVRKEFVEFHNKFGISVTAYAPIGASGFPYKPPQYKDLKPMKDPVILEIAKKYDKSPAQIILNWHLHRGVIVIPKTSKAKRLGENFNVFDFKLSDEDYDRISSLDKNARFYD